MIAWIHNHILFITISCSPTIFMVVVLLPVFPIPSVAVHVCTPLSRDLNIVSLILSEVELEAKQDLQVDDHL